MAGNGDRQGLAVARLMYGALLLTAAKTPYRRAGLAFPVGMPLTVAIRALDAGRLRQLLTDPAVTVLIGQDNGAFTLLPADFKDVDKVSDADLQTFIDAMPEVEVEAIAATPDGPEAELAELRQRLADMQAALAQANGRIEALIDADKQSAAALASAQADRESLITRVAELEAATEPAKPAARAKAKPAE